MNEMDTDRLKRNSPSLYAFYSAQVEATPQLKKGIDSKLESATANLKLADSVATQALPHGVYIAMNGRFFQWNKVNCHTGIFEEID